MSDMINTFFGDISRFVSRYIGDIRYSPFFIPVLMSLIVNGIIFRKINMVFGFTFATLTILLYVILNKWSHS